MTRRLWAVPAIAGWAAVGLLAMATGHARAVVPRPTIAASRPAAGYPWERLTDAQIDAIAVTGLPRDDDVRTPLAPPGDSDVPEERDRMDAFRERLADWPPAHQGDDDTRVRDTLSVAAIADVSQDPCEKYIARVAFERLRDDFDDGVLRRVLAWIILHPDDGSTLTRADALGVPGPVAESVVRDRSALYARKLLGRLLGKLPDVQPTTP